MTSDTLTTTISPQEAASLIARGAVLVDIREADEYARERIAGARHLPLSRVEAGALPKDAAAVIFHCRSGARTRANARQLAGGAACSTYLLEGGLEGWKRAGLPIVTDRRQPIEIMRQVQIAAGSLVVAGVGLGMTVAPGFHLLSAFIGAGLMFAGITGSCAMARALSFMPWNRRRTG